MFAICRHADHRGQVARATTIAKLAGRTFRAQVHVDTSYAEQSWAEIAVLTDQGFAVLLRQVGTEVNLAHAYHSMTPPARGEMERMGAIPKGIEANAEALIDLGAKIVG